MELADILPNPQHRRLVEWLVTPPKERVPRQQKDLAAEFGVDPRTVREWKTREDVRRAWKQAGDAVVGSPENVHEVIEEMRRAALDRENRGQVQAAKVYLEAVDAITPKEQTVLVSKKDLADFTDAELEQQIVERWGAGVE